VRRNLLGTNLSQAATILDFFLSDPDPPEQAPQTGHQWFDLICSQHPLHLVHKNGTLIPADIIGAPVELASERYQFFFREITDRSRLEQQLRQAEKLSSLAR